MAKVYLAFSEVVVGRKKKKALFFFDQFNKTCKWMVSIL